MPYFFIRHDDAISIITPLLMLMPLRFSRHFFFAFQITRFSLRFRHFHVTITFFDHFFFVSLIIFALMLLRCHYAIADITH